MATKDFDNGALSALAHRHGLDVVGGKIRRTSSRFCLGVEHGDYNGTELFGVGTDRFIWMAYKSNNTGKLRFVSHNFEDDGVITVDLQQVPPPKSAHLCDSWGRFPNGAVYVLQKEGYALSCGMDAVLFSNIPGGGMSRSASLTLNLILSILDVNGTPADASVEGKMKIVDMAQAVEADYIGAPVGNLDQIMILFAKEGMGTHYDPSTRTVSHIPLGAAAPDFAIVGLDTGTDRPGLEKSTYKVRREECDALAAACARAFPSITKLAHVTTEEQLQRVLARFENDMSGPCERLKYIFHAQRRFYQMLEAWRSGDIERVGQVFRQDGIGLRDVYRISGPELETMCDIVRTVPGVFGERMLGGGDKGAAGCIALSSAVPYIRTAVNMAYPRSRPDYKDKFAVHVCKIVDGVVELPGL